jgi:hypothetical protein
MIHLRTWVKSEATRRKQPHKAGGGFTPFQWQGQRGKLLLQVTEAHPKPFLNYVEHKRIAG